MAGTKYTRKPVKKVAKKNQSITQRGVEKKSVLGRALKNTAKGLGKGAMVVGSMSPAGKGVKAGKLITKALRKVNKEIKGPINKGHKAGVAKFKQKLKNYRTPAQIKKDKALMKADDKARKQRQYELREDVKYDRGGNRMLEYNPARARKALKKLGLRKNVLKHIK